MVLQVYNLNNYAPQKGYVKMYGIILSIMKQNTLWTVRGGKKNSPQWIMKAQVDYGIA
jgi:hypothetical protein